MSSYKKAFVENTYYFFFFQKTIYLDYPYPIKAVDYSYYPYNYKTYKPLTLYYDYYWPLSSLNRYREYWPYYPYYRYLYHKYTLPSDRYYHLKGVSINYYFKVTVNINTYTHIREYLNKINTLKLKIKLHNDHNECA